jgi:hypothetical protein
MIQLTGEYCTIFTEFGVPVKLVRLIKRFCMGVKLTLREEHGLRVSENRVVLGSASALKRDEIVKGGRKLYNEELKNFSSPVIIIRMIKCKDDTGRACSTHGEGERIKYFDGKAKRKETTRKA